MSTTTSLVPGYKQVEAFGPDEEYESDEEVEYVTLDLGAIEPALVPSSSSFRLIGLDTPTPFLQLSGTVFKGQHQSLLGTELLFTDARDSDADRTRKPLVHVGTSERRIRFREVELKAKSDKNPETTTQVPVKAVPKGKNNKKDRIPETVKEVVGSAPEEVQPRRRRGGRRVKEKVDDKDKTFEPADNEMEVDNRSEEQPASTVLGPSHRATNSPTVGTETPSLTNVHMALQQSLVQWSSDAPEGSEHAFMDTTEG